MLVLVVTWLMAPGIHRHAGHADGAAWVPLFMLPTGVIGLLVCGINLVVARRALLIAASVILMIHLAIGAGLQLV
jgi:hypothetical protein